MNRDFQHQQDTQQGSSQYGQHQPMSQRGQQGQQPMGQQGQQGQQPMGQQGQQGQQPMGQQGQQTGTGGRMQRGPSQQSTGQRGQQMGGPQDQQMGSQQGQQMGSQQPATRFDDHFTDELRLLLEDFNEVTHVVEWCATQCSAAGPELAECARICADIAELAELNEKLIARDSMFGPEVADLFVRVATEGLPELQRHQHHHPHITETVATIERTINSCTSVLEMGGQEQGQPQMPMQGQGQGQPQMPMQEQGQSRSQMPMQGQDQSRSHGRSQTTETHPQQGRQQQWNQQQGF